MHLFYTPDISGSSYTLNEEESRHAISVLRLGKGSMITLVDGSGGMYEAEITEPHPKKTQLSVISHQTEVGKKDFRIHIAIAPTKNIDRFEWFLEKATEIGIDEITPIICQRSERKEVKTERLNKVITSAVKQSIKAYHPQLNDPVRFSEFLDNDRTDQKFIAHCLEENRQSLSHLAQRSMSYLILIGPEGDFTTQEIKQACQNGFSAVTLGEARLRTETAGLYACFCLNFLNQ